MSDNLRPWKPGQSGNPGGRPAGVGWVRELARQHTELAINTLAEICGDSGAKSQARVAAAVALLDRGYGKPEARDALTEATDDTLLAEVRRRAVLERSGAPVAVEGGDGSAH